MTRRMYMDATNGLTLEVRTQTGETASIPLPDQFASAINTFILEEREERAKEYAERKREWQFRDKLLQQQEHLIARILGMTPDGQNCMVTKIGWDEDVQLHITKYTMSGPNAGRVAVEGSGLTATEAAAHAPGCVEGMVAP